MTGEIYNLNFLRQFFNRFFNLAEPLSVDGGKRIVEDDERLFALESSVYQRKARSNFTLKFLSISAFSPNSAEIARTYVSNDLSVGATYSSLSFFSALSRYPTTSPSNSYLSIAAAISYSAASAALFASG